MSQLNQFAKRLLKKPSRAPGDPGARGRETGVYTGVHEDFEPPSNAGIPSAVGFSTASQPFSANSAAARGLSLCHTCGKLSSISVRHCPRCDTTLHFRKPDSLQRTWALLLTACVLYIPANVLPIMQNEFLGEVSENTIISGVIVLWEHGSYPVAAVIVIASVFVPLAKLFALSWLCFSVNRQHQARPRQRTVLYRLTELVGRWSMVDVFVVAVLVALIQLGSLMSIRPGPAALAFAGVVIVTMFAAMSFDPRLIWDTQETEI